MFVVVTEPAHQLSLGAAPHQLPLRLRARLAPAPRHLGLGLGLVTKQLTLPDLPGFGGFGLGLASPNFSFDERL